MLRFRRAAVAVIVLLTFAPSLALGQEKAGVVTTLEGNVTAARPALAQPVALKFKDDVYRNDRITTGDRSLARMLLGGKAVVTVRERSVITITEIPGRSTIELASGKIGLAVAKERMQPGERIEVKTPNAVCAVRGTVVVAEVERATAQAGGSTPPPVTHFWVLRGAVEAWQLLTGGAGTPFQVGALQGFTAAGGAPPTVSNIPPGQLGQITGGLTPSGLPQQQGGDQIVNEQMQMAVVLANVFAGPVQTPPPPPPPPLNACTGNGCNANQPPPPPERIALSSGDVGAGLTLKPLVSVDPGSTITQVAGGTVFSVPGSLSTNQVLIEALNPAGTTTTFDTPNSTLLQIAGTATAGSGLNLDPTVVNAKTVIDITGTVNLSGPLLTDDAGIYNISGNFLQVTGGTVQPSSPGAAAAGLVFKGSTVGVTGDLVSATSGSAVTLNGPGVQLGSAPNGEAPLPTVLVTGGRALTLTDSTMDLGGQPLIRAFGENAPTALVLGTEEGAPGAVRLVNSTLQAQALYVGTGPDFDVATPNAPGNVVFVNGSILDLDNATVKLDFVGSGADGSSFFNLASGQALYALKNNSSLTLDAHETLAEIGGGGSVSGVGVIASDSTIDVGQLLKLGGVALTDPNTQLQLTNATVKSHLDMIRVDGQASSLMASLLDARGGDLSSERSLLSVAQSTLDQLQGGVLLGFNGTKVALGADLVEVLPDGLVRVPGKLASISGSAPWDVNHLVRVQVACGFVACAGEVRSGLQGAAPGSPDPLPLITFAGVPGGGEIEAANGEPPAHVVRSAMFDLEGANTVIAGGVRKATDQPLRHAGTLFEGTDTRIRTGEVVRVDTALLEATAPVAALLRSKLTVLNDAISLLDAAQLNATIANSPGNAVLRLDAASLRIASGSLASLSNSFMTIVNGYLFSLLNSSTLNIANGALLTARGNSSFNLTGALGYFGAGTNTLNIAATPGAGILTSVGDVPVLLLNGAGVNQVSVKPGFIPFVQGTGTSAISGSNTATIAPGAAAIVVDGPKATVILGPKKL